jgi:hypothetical protein
LGVCDPDVGRSRAGGFGFDATLDDLGDGDLEFRLGLDLGRRGGRRRSWGRPDRLWLTSEHRLVFRLHRGGRRLDERLLGNLRLGSCGRRRLGDGRGFDLGLLLGALEDPALGQPLLQVLDGGDAVIRKPESVLGNEDHRLAIEFDRELVREDPFDRDVVCTPCTEFILARRDDDEDVVQTQKNRDAGTSILRKPEMTPEIHLMCLRCDSCPGRSLRCARNCLPASLESARSSAR